MSSLFASVTAKAKEKCPGLEQKALAAKEKAMGMAGPLASKIPGVAPKPAVGSGLNSAAEPYYPAITDQPLGGPQAAHAAAGTSHPYQDHHQQQLQLQSQPQGAPVTAGGKPGSFSDKLKVYGEKAKGAKELAKIYVNSAKQGALTGKPPATA